MGAGTGERKEMNNVWFRVLGLLFNNLNEFIAVCEGEQSALEAGDLPADVFIGRFGKWLADKFLP